MNIFQLELNKSLWKRYSQELESYLGRSIKQIEYEYRALLKSEQQVEENLYKTNHKELLKDYYQTTNRYIYELTRWEAAVVKQKEYKRIWLFLKQKRISSVLDFGGGAGGFCCFLAARGIPCEYLDVKGPTFNFAQWRFHHYRYDVTMYDANSQWPDCKYEAITAYDVLEHLSDLDKFVPGMAAMLKPGGYFIHKSSFSGAGLHLKENGQYLDWNTLNNLFIINKLIYRGRLKSSFFSEINEFFGGQPLAIRMSVKKKFGGNFLIYQKDE